MSEITKAYESLKKQESRGYYLNPDVNFTKSIIKGLLANNERYGYSLCPCRLGSGKKELDKDVICPCIYRDADVSEYGNCFCALYVSKAIIEGKAKTCSIPERRGKIMMKNSTSTSKESSNVPMYRCSVCGYLCARNEPPDTCPICGASKDRFEKFKCQ